MRTCARSCSTLTDSPASRTRPRRPSRCACSRAGSAVRTSRRSASRPPGRCSATKLSRVRPDGTRVALIHHLPCGECERCLAGHESTCAAFAAPTIVPGGFAEAVEAADGLELPDAIDDAVGTYLEPLACVLRGAERVPRGRVLVVGQGFVGRLFAAVLRARGDAVYATDTRPERAGRAPDGLVDVAVLCAPAAPLDVVAPGGTVLVFSPAAPVDLDLVYRNELTLTGSRSATPRHMRAALDLLPALDLPEPTVLPLDRFADGLALYRSGPRSRWCSRREGAALPRPRRPAARGGAEPRAGAGRRARPGRGRAHRRHRPEDVPPRPPRPAAGAAEPVRARVLWNRRRHRQAGRRGQLGRGRRARQPLDAPNGAYAECWSSPRRSPRSTC